jgi:pseudaminic acid synthase
MIFKKPFFIAEISANHNGSINRAKKLIKLAKKNGADAVKLQTYTPDTMTPKSNKDHFKIKKGLWKGYNLWDLYNKGHTPYSWHKELFEYARNINIKIFSSPFDETAVNLLESLNCPFYKVASFEITDYPLIKKISKTKKTLIISTGLADLKEIEFTYKYAKKNGAKEIILLYCVSKYPSLDDDFNLNNIKILKQRFNCTVGFSDHSNNNQIAFAAIAAGAEVIEKHIALDDEKKGLDYEFSLRGKEIKKFKDMLVKSYDLLGKKYFYRNKDENKNKYYRRSIFAVEDILPGDKFTKKNIKVLRPNIGISSFYYEKILGKKSPSKVKCFDPLKLNIIKKLKLKLKV